MSRFEDIYNKHKEIILYLFWGAITTIISLMVCFATLKIGVIFMHDANGEPTAALDAIGSVTQWISGVAVAFVSNKLWVFTEAEKGNTGKQLLKFSAARIATLFVEMGVNLAVIASLGALGYRAFDLLGVEISSRVWAKVVSSVVVVISNYFLSKLFIFTKKKEK